MIRENILVTIIVPVYNLELYIGDCIQSILRQTYTNLQVIIVDDGSTDNSRSIIREYAKRDSRINALYQTNLGVSSARNNGLRNAKGQFIMFVDGDDEIECVAVEKLLRLACSYNVDVVCCNFVYENKEKGIYRKGRNGDFFYLCGRDEILKRYLLGDAVWSVCWARFYNKTFLDKNEICFEPKLSINEDGFFTLQVMSKVSSAIITSECLYRIKVRSSSVTRNSAVEMNIDITPSLYKDYLISNKLWATFEGAYKAWYIRSGASKLLRLAVKVQFSVYHSFWMKYMKESQYLAYNSLKIRSSLGLRNHFISLLIKSPFCSYYFMHMVKVLFKKNSLF